MKNILFLTIFIVLSWSVSAQPTGYQVGQKIDLFTLPDEAGQQVNLQKLAGKKAVVLVFTNKNCPYSKLYQKRLQKLSTNYTSKEITFLFIKSAVGTDQHKETVTSATDDKRKLQDVADLSYLEDSDLKVTHQFGATRTPEVFVLQPQGSEFILRYKGAIDDNPQVETYAKENYLQDAIEAVIQNKPPAVTSKRATGCMIKHF